MPGFTQSLGLIGHMWRKEFTQCDTSTLRFQTASNNLVGLLTVGNVIGTGVTVTDYVIEWHLGSVTGTILFISGHGSDPDIQAVHPIVSEPVISGVLYAVIRYIIIDGIKYSPYFMQGQYSPDLIACLGSVTVAAMNCANGTPGTWTHSLTYTASIDPAQNAERTVKFDLATDGSTAWIAYQFAPQNVADRVTFSYVSVNDEANPIVLSDWVAGVYAIPDFTANPKVEGSYYASSLKILIDLSSFTYTEGDYLLIKVTPRVQNPTAVETNWALYWTCLTSAQYQCFTLPSGARTIDISTIVMEWSETSCAYILSFRNNTLVDINAQLGPYLNVGTYQGTYGVYGWGGDLYKYGISLPQRTIGYSYATATYNYTTCIDLSGNINVVKSGADLTFTFSSVTDYNLYKQYYSDITNNTQWVNYYSADPTNLSHYSAYYMYIKIANSCNESATSKTFQFSRDSTITFNDGAMTLVINMVAETNGITPGACTGYNQIQSQIDAQIVYINQADFNVTTFTRIDYPFVGFAIYQYLQVTNSATGGVNLGVRNVALLEGCVPVDWWNVFGTVFGTYLSSVTVVISDMADPVNNFVLFNWLNDDGTYKVTSEKVYEIENGIQIFP